jgi:hypothetical protein
MSFSLCLVNGCGAVFVRLDLSHGGSVELQSVGIVDDAVEDGVGEGGLADDLVPLGQRQLAGDQGGGVLVSVLDDLHEIAALIGVEPLGSPVVEDEEVCLGKRAEQAGIASVGAAEFQFGEHPGQAFVEHGEVVAAGFVAKRAANYHEANSCASTNAIELSAPLHGSHGPPTAILKALELKQHFNQIPECSGDRTP